MEAHPEDLVMVEMEVLPAAAAVEIMVAMVVKDLLAEREIRSYHRT